MLSVVFFNESEDLTKGFLKNVLKFLVDLDSFDDVFVALPDDFKPVS